MKKNLFFAAALVMSSIVSAQTNLVTNGDFETGTLAPWQKGWVNSYTEPTIDASRARSSNFGAGYANPSATTGFYQVVDIIPSTQYTLSFWYKATGNKDARLWSNFYQTGTTSTPVYLGSSPANDPLRTNNGYLTPGTDWMQHTVNFTSLANVDRFVLAVRTYKNGTTSFDDFSLVQGTLSTVDFSKSKLSLVKYTQVSDVIEFAKASEVKIYNMNGQVVKEAKVSVEEKLSVSDLASGMYIVTGIVSGEKVSQKILKK
ncbi:T9SS type A sorting domain-containing protein [Bergeyella zoohelcum]|uniref:T9SS type A sorting domain-containing protein n=1 Tax=Bergeyella zoohelcum TaxID=1015 RepID=UPI002A91AB47|nr:T9SS type A sorting domain-containing protein [Bergeyella zoohelcum]MDY6025893.1 T9SS type A sorting domain-containing protein [Bergeyella zoohelcum]